MRSPVPCAHPPWSNYKQEGQPTVLGVQRKFIHLLNQASDTTDVAELVRHLAAPELLRLRACIPIIAIQRAAKFTTPRKDLVLACDGIVIPCATRASGPRPAPVPSHTMI